MGLIVWAALGMAAGVFIRAVNDKRQDDLASTLATAVAGALLGGLIASAIGLTSISSLFSPSTWPMAIAGAFLALALFHTPERRSSARRSQKRTDA